ncbi:MAG: acyltransferase [Arenimonas sp.]|nr:acyltransferase [Arenimonas sp.]
MFVKIPALIRVPIILILIAINTIVLVSILLGFSVLKWCVPIPAFTRHCERIILYLAEAWISNNSWMMRYCTSVQIHYAEGASLDPRGHYLVLSNHQSWVDILVLQSVFNYRIPFMRFFLKQQLIWVPLLGLAWWALDFPFMKRHSKSQIQKNPALAGQDIAATRKACEKFLGKPVSIMIFPEGTRFTPSKHAHQQSPYANLLKPKSGGMAYALDAMGQGLHAIIDVTLYYPNGIPDMWDLIADRVKCLHVDVRVRDIPEQMRAGDYENDRAFRVQFQAWMNGLWLDKQQKLNSLSSS